MKCPSLMNGRKLLWLLPLLSILLSLLCVPTAATDPIRIPDGVNLVLGEYAGAGRDAFTPVGTVTVVWSPDVADQVDLTDGDTSEWATLGYTPISITENQMVSWIGGQSGVRDPGIPEEWGVEAYFVADPDYLYMIFEVTDSNFTYSDEKTYDGDAIQLSIDMGGRMEAVLNGEGDDGISNFKNIFYSFGCEADGAPIRIMRQESDQDGWLSEENGDGVKGTSRKTATGWCAEIAISWQQLYDDVCWKTWNDKTIYVGTDVRIPLEVGMALTYLNRTETAGEVTWAASTTRGLIDGDNGAPVLSWTAFDDGITLEVPFVDQMSFHCSGIVVINPNCIGLPPEETEYNEACTEPGAEPDWPTEIATEPPATPWEPPVTYETEAETAAVEEPASEGLAPELNAILEKYGCSGTAGFSAIALLAAAAVAVALKKKD